MSFTVYRSSAGSGKTFTLVKEYLGIVLKRPSEFRNILAITFTNKAANEMRERIINSLKEIAAHDEYADSVAVKFMLPELLDLTGLEKEKVCENAATVLHNIMHNYQDFSVGTIDSFIHRIIRTFAFDLQLPLNFEVEVDAKTMVSMAVDLLLSRVGHEEMPTKILKKYAESRIDDEKNWDIESELKAFSRHLLKDDIATFLPGLDSMDAKTLLTVSSQLISQVKAFENELSAKAGKLMECWDRSGVGAKDFSYGMNGVYGYIYRLTNNDFSKIKPGSRVTDAFENGNWYSKKLDPARKGIIDGLKNEMHELSRNIKDHIDQSYTRYVFYRLLKRNIFPLAILSEIESVLEQIREAEGIIHISEFDKRIAEVVNNEPVPYIYERLGERYRHFLVDEFQDTSILEWQNILPLIENSLAEAHFNMIVGDAKQAIYRFKGGEVEQLVELPEIYKKPATPEMDAREKQLHDFYDPRNLKANYRSRKEIIDFNNELYSFLADMLPEKLRKIYAGCKQEFDPDKAGGEVRISFIDEDGTNEMKEPFYFDQILSYVIEMKQEHAYSLRDMAILCRSNNDASKIARNLLMNGIDVISTESLLLRSSAEVNFLIFCLDYISNNEDKIALAGIISYLVDKQGEGRLHAILEKCLLALDKDEGVPGLKAFNQFLSESGINFKPDDLKQMGLYEKVESLLRIFSLDASPDPYIFFFLDAVFEYTRNRRLPAEEFTSYWREHNDKYSIVVPEGLDAVNVMTIHKAKGLEFPVVVYPFANSKVSISKDKKWVHIDDPELPGLNVALLPLTNDLLETDYAAIHEEESQMALLDMLNILYVATTRPTERLAIICDKALAKSGKVIDIPSMLRSFLEHKDLWIDKKTSFVLGDSTRIPAREEKDEEALMPQELISGDWRQNIVLSGNAAECWDLEDDARNIEWGNLVHNILSGVNTIDDVETVIGAEIIKGNLRKEEAVSLHSLLNNIIGQPALKPFFDGSYEIRNEAAIMTSSGKEYRPDRLMIDHRKAIVIDYKTGKEDPSHIRQIETYGNLLSDMGYTDIEKYLLYIDEHYRLMKV
ncbi:MAG: UvrD-helicase domain-containing protein [Bacteroidota bacterium]